MKIAKIIWLIKAYEWGQHFDTFKLVKDIWDVVAGTDPMPR